MSNLYSRIHNQPCWTVVLSVQNNRGVCLNLCGKRVCLSRTKQRSSSGFVATDPEGTQSLRQRSCVSCISWLIKNQLRPKVAQKAFVVNAFAIIELSSQPLPWDNGQSLPVIPISIHLPSGSSTPEHDAHLSPL